MKNIYDLDLHESVKYAGSEIENEVMRVPGGWIYNFMTRDKNRDIKICRPIFVPYSGEFFKPELSADNVKKYPVIFEGSVPDIK